jgi:hypothetical protein
MKRKLTGVEIRTLRTAKTRATSKHGLGGLEKRHSIPKPIILRRADYDRQKGGK